MLPDMYGDFTAYQIVDRAKYGDRSVKDKLTRHGVHVLCVTMQSYLETPDGNRDQNIDEQHAGLFKAWLKTLANLAYNTKEEEPWVLTPLSGVFFKNE